MCTAEMTTQWKETTLPTILSRYKLVEIYNADEFGLFFRMQPYFFILFYFLGAPRSPYNLITEHRGCAFIRKFTPPS